MVSQLKKNKDFYKILMTIAIPIMIQNGITNFVNLLDNLMVGQLGTLEMSSVSISNQLIFVFNLTMFGGLAGAGIFTSQFFGKKDMHGVKQTIRFKLYLACIILLCALALFRSKGSSLISMYLKGDNSAADTAATLSYALEYIHIMMIGFIPFAFTQSLASTLRECGQTKLPMKAGVTAILVNLVFNYLLIFGHFGFPCLGVKGAAVATVISRFAEVTIIFTAVKLNRDKYYFMQNIFDSFKIDGALAGKILIKGAPLLANESLWAFGISLVARCYSFMGLGVVAAYNITSTVTNLFKVVYLSMGTTTAIVLGHDLGANKKERAFEDANKILWFSVGLGALISVMLFVASFFIPSLYNTSHEIRLLATKLIIVFALFAPVQSFINVAYYVVRSGGKTFVTFLFDAGFVWAVTLPVAYIVSHFTGWGMVWCYFIVNFADILKAVIGYILIQKKIWVVNMVGESQ